MNTAKPARIWSNKRISALTEECLAAVGAGRASITVNPGELGLALTELMAYRAWEDSMTRAAPQFLGGDQPRP